MRSAGVLLPLLLAAAALWCVLPNRADAFLPVDVKAPRALLASPRAPESPAAPALDQAVSPGITALPPDEAEEAGAAAMGADETGSVVLEPSRSQPTPSAASSQDRTEEMPLVPAWRRYAAASPEALGRPMIAIVIDDLGHNGSLVGRAVALESAVTLAFLPYTSGVERHVRLARQAHHEVLVHLPMESLNPKADPGPNALATDLEHDEMLRRLRWNLGRFDEYVGVNNHMGSRFTGDPKAMAEVMLELKNRGLLFLDSRTTPDSVARRIAQTMGVPSARRDVFVDPEPTRETIERGIERLERLATQKGFAIGIAHPFEATFSALEDWLPGLEARGFVLVPISAVVR